MIPLIAAIIVLAFVLCVITLVQILYMESMRLRRRERPMLEFFGTTLEAKIGIRDEHGALAFSVVKHTSLLAMSLLILATRLGGGTPLWVAMLEAAGITWLLMLLTTYLAPHLLYRRTSGRWLLPLVPFLRVMTFVVKPVAAILAFF